MVSRPIGSYVALKNTPAPNFGIPRRFATFSSTSNTKMRIGRCTCGPARPTPSYACIVSIMSSMSGRNFPDLMSLGLTSAAFSRKTGCPSLETFSIAMKLVLFDIDGTLITDGGASRDAFAAALLDVFEYNGDLQRYDFSGRTDPQIAHMILRDAGWHERDINARMPGLWEKYLHELEQHERSRVRELPGIRVLLDALRPHVTLALLTGNIERGARLKLS